MSLFDWQIRKVEKRSAAGIIGAASIPLHWHRPVKVNTDVLVQGQS